MIGLLLLAAALTTGQAAQNAFNKDPKVFCDAVWSSMITEREGEGQISQSDSITLTIPNYTTKGDMTLFSDSTKIICERPSWYIREPKTFDIRAHPYVPNYGGTAIFTTDNGIAPVSNGNIK